MTGNLPPLIAAFVEAKNAYDSNAFAACFTEDAVVYDEGREMVGPAAIKEWNEASNRKYQDTLTVLALVEFSDETVLTAQVAGNFVGSPVSLDFHFAIRAGKISRLAIDFTGNQA